MQSILCIHNYSDSYNFLYFDYYAELRKFEMCAHIVKLLYVYM